MSDLIKRMGATIGMGVISSGSTAHEYSIAEAQFREAKTALEAKDAEIARLEAKCDQRRDDLKQARDILDERFRDIARLKEELDNERAKGIHSCGPDCKRPLCVANKENERLRAALEEIANRPSSYDEVLMAREALNFNEEK